MIVALCELGISLDDPRFVKGGNTMLDNLMTFYQPGNGFLHTKTDPAPTRWRRSRRSTAWLPRSLRGRTKTASTAWGTPSPWRRVKKPRPAPGWRASTPT